MCHYDSGTKDVQKRQTDQVKTMKKTKFDSGQKSQSKKSKKNNGSSQSTQGQKAEVKGRAAGQDAYSPGPKRSSESTHSMQKRAQEEAKSTHSDSNSSQQHLMKTSRSAEDEKGELDLYRGQEEIEQELQEKHQAKSEVSVAVGEAQSSVSAAEDLQTYSKREWKGNTTKSQLIRKGYEAIASEFNLCIVRGDNYCALRATLFQVLSQSKQLPAWLHDSDIIKWPKEMHSDKDFIKEWQFPFESRTSTVQHLEQCLELLKKKWQESVECKTLEERERMCQEVFRGHDEEYELLEALKFLMLRTAIQLHSNMEKGSDVPEFCWLLFARDSSNGPKTFLTNHLRHVGFSGGLEQVEMCLLGHSLQQTIRVVRLYKCDTEEFITYYPDDHKEDWPPLCLVTEDDRHYNALVPKKSSKFDERGRPKWNQPSY
ncbi:OTU deubiquitinase with linear linkage specificity b isoform X1 [Pimephales promelas]|uniref:OTU deubiquitinase with linear linkage specificity b isoform X1 n=2 Tax=Pimephales promelas TaxID=90988 RepID=UPI0019557F76|nr:OTU deubiquitinase with linear linkage specificity b isoform X1 [Pimephales promelas]XP_039533818.1 OTU deubiquitinase with linear linkage specificity b isoform X1 [Pimephales promelas]